VDWSLATVAVLILATLTFAWLREDPQFAEAPSWFWRMKLSWKPAADLVCVGDSTVYRGIDPAVLEKACAASHAVNFGFSNAPLSRYLLLDAVSKFKVDARNKRLVIGVTHWAFTPEARRSNGYIEAKQVELRSRIPLAWEITIDSLLERLKPIQLDLVLRSPDAVPFARAAESEYLQRYDMNGWVASDYVHPNPARGLASRSEDFKGGNTVKAELIVEARDVLQEIQDRDGVQVILVPMRSHPEVDVLSERLGGMELTALAAALRPTRGEIFEFHPSAMDSYDGVHLNSGAAARVSQSIADFAKILAPADTKQH
jgi:hypothetical protein